MEKTTRQFVLTSPLNSEVIICMYLCFSENINIVGGL
jgi:hypothetical protein